MTRLLILFFGVVAVETAALAGRALYCQDPDTRKLHAVNSTWASTSFCGNYTCKIRVRNITELHYTPLKQINITNLKNQTAEESNTVFIDNKTEKPLEVIHNEKEDTNTRNVEESKEEKVAIETVTKNVVENNDPNRYLTDKEIKTISEILHNVKKSDLDAIVDIYNLAQDIYNEMDKTTNKGVVDETINDIVLENYRQLPRKSYWYDYLNNKERGDMEYQGSNIVTTVQPKRDVPTYFTGTLSNQDFGKIPYYYPISNFQRIASYLHTPHNNIQTERPKPCVAKQNRQKTQDMQTSQNVIKPSYLLPYPFAYVHPYNYTNNPSNIYFNNPQAWNNYNMQRQYHPYYNAYIAQVPNILNAVQTNPHLQDNIADFTQKPVEENLLGKVLSKTKDKIMPDWKTEELSSQILDEVRAHIDSSNIIKVFPFRNKIKLEKVGKLIKLDEMTRSKRSAIDEVLSSKVEVEVNKEEVREERVEEVTDDPTTEEGEYETYLEKTTCQTNEDPGYFRYGNLSQPYPGCCPQLIYNAEKRLSAD